LIYVYSGLSIGLRALHRALARVCLVVLGIVTSIVSRLYLHIDVLCILLSPRGTRRLVIYWCFVCLFVVHAVNEINEVWQHRFVPVWRSGWAYQRSYSTLSPVSTGMGGRFRTGKPPRSTQPPTLSGTGNEYRPKCGDAVRLGNKGRHGSFHLWINVWVAGKTV